MHKYTRYLFLLPIAVLAAFSLYFNNISKQVEAAILQERILRGSNLSRLIDWMNRGEVLLIAVTALLNIAMVYIIYRHAGANRK